MAKDKVLITNKLLLLIAFVEGAAVMAVELGGAKIIAPYYGTSLYVWSSVLAVTLGGLTLGYFLGGRATTKYEAPKLLFFEILIGSALIILMPFLALVIMPATSGLGIRMGSLITSIVFMMPPLVCMGMVSPTIIQLSNSQLKETGKTAGTVYAISTVGGILMTLLMGFFMLPELGIRISLYFAASPLAILAFILMLKVKNYKEMTYSVITLIIVFIMTTGSSFKDPQLELKYLYKSEGILGQISVLNNPDDDSDITYRHLFINHIAQTWVNDKYPSYSQWQYPHRFSALASIKPVGSKALLIGLGGGSIGMEFKRLGFEVDVVELDARIPEVAETYFGFEPEGMNLFLDDGRHYFKSTEEKYDIILIDVLNGETQPHHLFTMESLDEIKSILNPDGLLLINNQGYLQGPHSLGARSIYKTLVEAGFNTEVFKSKEDGGDIHFMATPGQLDFQALNEERMNPCCRQIPHAYRDLVTDFTVDTSDALILRDDKPKLELLNIYQNEEWRKTALGAIIKREKDNNIPFFK